MLTLAWRQQACADDEPNIFNKTSKLFEIWILYFKPSREINSNKHKHGKYWINKWRKYKYWHILRHFIIVVCSKFAACKLLTVTPRTMLVSQYHCHFSPSSSSSSYVAPLFYDTFDVDVIQLYHRHGFYSCFNAFILGNNYLYSLIMSKSFTRFVSKVDRLLSFSVLSVTTFTVNINRLH